MCRWIAYRGETITLDQYVTDPAHSLVAQSVRALEATASVNGDGFGLGWYGDHPEPGLYREIRPAWSDENLRYLCRHLRSHLFFAHVRAATGTPITRVNCHPFASGVWLFMHNGFVGGWNRVRRRVESMIPDALYPSRIGTTDSEALFLAIMGQGGARDPIGATEKVLQAITEMMAEPASPDPLRFTAALTNGHDVYAFRYAANDKANTLYFRESAREVLAVSEPLDHDRAAWTEVPEGHALVARPSERAKIVPLNVREASAARVKRAAGER
jgi:glutamine amidotransferase